MPVRASSPKVARKLRASVTSAAHAWSFAIPSHPRHLPWIRAMIPPVLRLAQADVSARGVWRITAVLMEAVTNSIRHAKPTRRTNAIGITLMARGTRVIIHVTDHGPKFSLPRRRVMATDKTSGRGLHIMRAWCSRLQLTRTRGVNRLRMEYDDDAPT